MRHSMCPQGVTSLVSKSTGWTATDVDMDIMSASFFVCYSMDCVAWRLVNTRTPCDLASCAVCPLPDHAAVAGQEQRRAILKGVAIRGRLMPGVVIDAVCRSCAGERVLRIMVTSGDGRGCGFRRGGERRRLSRHVFCKSNARGNPAVYASCFDALYPNGGLWTARKKGAASRTGIPPL